MSRDRAISLQPWRLRQEAETFRVERPEVRDTSSS
jgi:hypothetical protein